MEEEKEGEREEGGKGAAGRKEEKGQRENRWTQGGGRKEGGRLGGARKIRSIW